MLSASVGFGVHRNGEILDHGNHIRRVTRAWLDHLALVQTAAYGGAKVLAVRATRKLDAFRNDPIMAWANFRNDPAVKWACQRLSGRR